MITPRHRRRLNQAMHELRRPLQALVLLEQAGGTVLAGPEGGRRGLLELVDAALGELDRAVNGGAAAVASTRFSIRELVLGCLERWRAAAGDGGFRVLWDAGPAVVEGDRVRVAQAIDNLVANALEHGEPPLVVTGARVAGRVRITLANASAGTGAAPERTGGSPAGNGWNGSRRRDPRRGHGTAIVSEVASAHRGRFALCRTGGGCVAALELPLADPRYARAA